MDSNTAYHFSRLLETTPYLGHCWRVVKMERYRVCAARRKKREKNFRETRIVTRHRATARPYYVPRASNFTRASLRDVSLPFPFFFTISLQGKAFQDAQTSLPRGTDGGDRSAETISLALRFPRRASNPPNRPRILEHVIVRCARPTGGIGRNAWMMAERISAGHGLLLIDFTGSATPRIVTSESWYQTRASNPFHQLRSIGNNSSVNSNPDRLSLGSRWRWFDCNRGFHPSRRVTRHVSRHWNDSRDWS